jgi:hypothetical protein
MNFFTANPFQTFVLISFFISFLYISGLLFSVLKNDNIMFSSPISISSEEAASSESSPLPLKSSSSSNPGRSLPVVEDSSFQLVLAETISKYRKIYQIVDDFYTPPRPITFMKAILLFSAGNINFIMTLKMAITEFEAVFWECKPVSRNTLDNTIFEFIIISSVSLGKREVDTIPFEEHFIKAKESRVTSFKSTSGDAMLVVPCPPIITDLPPATTITTNVDHPLQYMTHLASFMRFSDHDHIILLFKELGRSMKVVFRQLQEDDQSNTPIWLSTSGLGVSWLHIRLDLTPKYYTFRKFTIWKRNKK